MAYKTLILGTALAALISSPAYAQMLDADIVVTGSRLEQTQSETGTSVTIITSEDIERLGFDFAVDAVASAPGVTVNQNGGFGGQAAVRIRGASSEQTLVLIDGVTVNDPSSPGGGLDFSRLDTQSIEKIEILKGPQSTLWGTDAIGGVVSITTKRPEGAFGGTAFAEVGSFNTIRGGASVSGGSDTGDYRLAVTGFDTDGISKANEKNGNTEEDGYNSVTLSGRGGLNVFGDARLEATLIYTDAETEFDSFVFGQPGNVGDGDEVTETEELSGNVALKFNALDDRLDNLFLVGYSDIDRQSFTNGAKGFGAKGDRTTLRYQGTYTANDSNKFAFGAEHEQSSAGKDETDISGLFGLYELKPVDTLTLTGGVRMDDHETFGQETTARVAAAWDVNDVMTLRANWGQGFKAPTIFQTTFFCCGATSANADVQAETSEGFEFGLDAHTPDNRGRAGITFFSQDVENLITFSFAQGGYANIPGAETQGVEVYGELQILDWLSVMANYAYLDAVDNNSAQLIRVPQNSGDIALAFDFDNPWSGAVLARFNGDEIDSTGDVEAWSRIDVNAAYALSDSVDLYGRVENLFDEEYEQLLGYGTPERSGSIGVRLRY